MEAADFLIGFFIGLLPGLIIGALFTFLVMINIRAEAPTYDNESVYSEMDDLE